MNRKNPLTKDNLKILDPEVYEAAAQDVVKRGRGWGGHWSCVAIKRACRSAGKRCTTRERHSEAYADIFQWSWDYDQQAPWWNGPDTPHNQRQRRDALLMMAAIVRHAKEQQ